MLRLSAIAGWCLFFIFLNTFPCSCTKPSIEPSSGRKPPIARAGEDQQVTIPFSNSATLDGSQSSGDTMDPLSSFSWRIIYPSGWNYIVSRSASFNFRFDDPGKYLFELVVASKTGLKAFDTAVVIAKYDSNCYMDRKIIPISLKSLTSFSYIEDDPLLYKVSDKLALITNVKDGLSFNTKINLYNLSNGITESQILKNGRKNMGIGVLSDKIYMAGGNSNEEYIADIDIYDARNNLWTKESLSQPRSHCVAVAAEGKILFAGGYAGTLNFSDRVDVYDTAKKTWETVKLTEPRGEIFAQYDNGKVYFIGGRNTTGISSTVDVYDCSSGKMSNFSLPFNRHGFCSIVYQNKLYIAGGFVKTDNENFNAARDVQILDLMTNSWSYGCLSIPINWKSNTQAMVQNQKIVFPFQPLDGIDDWFEHYLDILDPFTGHWEKASLNLSSVSFLKATSLDGKIYVLLRIDYNEPLKLMEVEF